MQAERYNDAPEFGVLVEGLIEREGAEILELAAPDEPVMESLARYELWSIGTGLEEISGHGFESLPLAELRSLANRLEVLLAAAEAVA